MSLELINLRTGLAEALPSVEIAVRGAGGRGERGRQGWCVAFATACRVPMLPDIMELLLHMQVTVVDGDSYSESAPANYGHVRELLKNDDVGHCSASCAVSLPHERDGIPRASMRHGPGFVHLRGMAT